MFGMCIASSRMYHRVSSRSRSRSINLQELFTLIMKDEIEVVITFEITLRSVELERLPRRGIRTDVIVQLLIDTTAFGTTEILLTVSLRLRDVDDHEMDNLRPLPTFQPSKQICSSRKSPTPHERSFPVNLLITLCPGLA